MIKLNLLSEQARKVAIARGLGTDTLKCLKHCAGEVSEATASLINWTYGKGEQDLEKRKTDFEDELADIIMCCLVICGAENINIEKALVRCYDKNKARAKKGEGMTVTNKDNEKIYEVWEIGPDYVKLKNDEGKIIKITKTEFQRLYRGKK